jgi:hypothetical protein
VRAFGKSGIAGHLGSSKRVATVPFTLPVLTLCRFDLIYQFTGAAGEKPSKIFTLLWWSSIFSDLVILGVSYSSIKFSPFHFYPIV